MYPSMGKLKRCFYYQVVELAERPYAREQYLAQLFILIYGLIRISIFLTLLFSANASFFAKYDYLVYLGVTYRQYYDLYTVSVHFFFEFFIFVNASVHYRLSPNSYTVQWYFQMVVLGERALLASQYSQDKIDKLQASEAAKLDSNLKATFPRVRALIPLWFRIQLIRLLAKATLWVSLGTVDHRQFARRHQFEMNPNISVKLRLRLLQRLLLADKIFAFVQLYIAIFTLLALAIVFSQVRGGMSSFAGPALFLIEFSIILYQITQLVYYAYFSIMAIQASAFTAFSLLKSQQRALKGALTHARKNPSAFHRQVDRFLVELHPICEFTLRGNGEVSATVFFAFLLTNVPGNVYAIWRLTRRGNPPEVVAVLGLLMGLQVLATWTVMGPMAKFASAIRVPAQVLPAVQGRLSPLRLPLKLKVENLYATLLGGTIAGTVGPLNAVTYGYIFEFLYTYTSLLLMAFTEEQSLTDLVKY